VQKSQSDLITGQVDNMMLSPWLLCSKTQQMTAQTLLRTSQYTTCFASLHHRHNAILTEQQHLRIFAAFAHGTDKHSFCQNLIKWKEFSNPSTIKHYVKNHLFHTVCPQWSVLQPSASWHHEFSRDCRPQHPAKMFIMAALRSRCGHYIFAMVSSLFFLSSSFFIA